MHGQANGFKNGIKLPPIEGISAEVTLGKIPSIDELLKTKGKMPLIMAYGLPEPIVAIKIMVGVTPFDERDGVGLSTANFLANLELKDTQEVEDSLDDLLREGPADGPQIQSDRDKDIRRQVLKGDNSIILGADTVINLDDTKFPKKELCAFTSKVFTTALTIIRNHSTRTIDASSLDPIGLGSFELSTPDTGNHQFSLRDL